MPVSLRCSHEHVTTKTLTDLWTAHGPPLIQADEYITVRAFVTSVDVPSRVTLDDGDGPVSVTAMPSALPALIQALGSSRAVIVVLQARSAAPNVVEDLDAVAGSARSWSAMMPVHRSIVELAEREESKVRKRLGMEHGGLFVIAACFADELRRDEVLPSYDTAPALIEVMRALASKGAPSGPAPERRLPDPGVRTLAMRRRGEEIEFDAELERIRVALFSSGLIKVQRSAQVEYEAIKRRAWVEVDDQVLRTRYLAEGLARLRARDNDPLSPRDRTSLVLPILYLEHPTFAGEFHNGSAPSGPPAGADKDAAKMRELASRLRLWIADDPEAWADEVDLPEILERAALRAEV